MSASEPSIVERLPRYRTRILELQRSDPAIQELCEDYDRVIEALAVERTDHGASDEADYRELARLARELEEEILARLSPGDGSDPAG